MIELQLGDCLDLLPNLQDNSVDLVLVDLPYGTTPADWDKCIDMNELWLQYNRIGKSNCAYLFFAAQPFTSLVIGSNIENFKYCWYWEKEKGTGFLNAKHQPLRAIEEICVFYEKRPTYNPQMVLLDKPYKHKLPHLKSELTNEVESFKSEKYIYTSYTHAHPKNLLKFARDKHRIHSTQKPVALLEYLIKTYTNQGDLVLDNAMGSGSTGVACKNLKRCFIGIEIEEEMFKKAKERIYKI
jgi:site-specific DNA-methyltransferase (adenine-specific)